jgi:pimeloyl-ACP methyl ester carboxylesterase
MQSSYRFRFRLKVQQGLIGSVAFGLLAAGSATAQTRFVTIDRFVPHASTVPANAGRRVGIFVREKLSRDTADAIGAGRAPAGIVLFVHGNSVPSVPDYDLPYEDYSWMAYLAEAGFDTFAMDHSGYGFSPRPSMDDPCNMSRDDQAVVTPNPLPGPCEPSYGHSLTTFQSDWDEIDAVVDYVRRLRGVDRVHLIGWSMGGPRAGGYAARHADKVDKLVLFAPAYDASSPSEAPATFPPRGVPMTLQTREALMQDRWQSAVACEDQVDPGIREVVWQTIMGFESYGSVWGTPEGVMRVRTFTPWGWNADFAARVTAPTLILVGEQDGLLPASEALYPALAGTRNKVLVKMACATHFAIWEATQYKFMHEASKQWLMTGQFRGRRDGSVSVGVNGGPP